MQAVTALATWQPPEPLHAPVSPQGGLAGQNPGSRGDPPGAMDVQVPGVAMQVWQLPVQAELQHKPWVQKPRPQSAFAEHAQRDPPVSGQSRGQRPERSLSHQVAVITGPARDANGSRPA